MADKRISQLVERTDIANNDVVPIVASGASTTNKATISSIQTYMQENLDVGVTSVGITLGSSGTDVNVTGSPITTSGNITINIPTASATNRGLLSSADWSTFNGKQNSITLTTTGTSGPSTLIGSTLNIPNYTTDLSGYVTLGTAQTITAQKTFTTSGSSDTMIISHGSGSGFALDVIKAGNGEAIRVNKTSGSGNAMTIIGGNFEAPTIVKTGGTSAQFLKADGSVDSSTYLTTSGAASVYVPYTGATTSVNLGDNVLTSGGLNIDDLGGSGGALNLRQATSFSLWSGAPYTSIYATTGNNLIINFSNDNRRITLNGSIVSASTPRTFTFPDATGTLALTSDLGGYLPLAGGILTGGLFGTTAQFSGDIQSGTRLIASATSQSIILHPNNAGTTNRIEGVGTLPLALVSGASITLAAGGTTPQITLNSNGTTDFVTTTSTFATMNSTNANGGVLSFRRNGTNVGHIGNSAQLGGGVLDAIEVRSGVGSSVILKTDGGQLTLATGGAATFSSSVTTLGSVDITGTGNVLTLRKANNAPALTFIGATSDTIIEGGNTFNLYTGGTGSRIFVNASGNVGIATASPESGWKFDVAGIATMGGTSGNGRLYVSTEGTTNGATYLQARNLSVATPLHFFSSVNYFQESVGIGTASPAAKLQVTDSGGVTRVVIDNTGNAAAGAGIFMRTFNGATQVSNATLRVDNAGNFQIYSGAASDSLGINISPSARVLIGTATDKGALAGTLQVTGGIHSSTGYYNTGVSVTIAALNTNYILVNRPYSGLIVLRDNLNGGSAVWLADPNQGYIQIANNMPGAWSITYSAPNTVIQKTSGNTGVVLGVAFYSNEYFT